MHWLPVDCLTSGRLHGEMNPNKPGVWKEGILVTLLNSIHGNRKMDKMLHTQLAHSSILMTDSDKYSSDLHMIRSGADYLPPSTFVPQKGQNIPMLNTPAVMSSGLPPLGYQ